MYWNPINISKTSTQNKIGRIFQEGLFSLSNCFNIISQTPFFHVYKMDLICRHTDAPKWFWACFSRSLLTIFGVKKVESCIRLKMPNIASTVYIFPQRRKMYLKSAWKSVKLHRWKYIALDIKRFKRILTFFVSLYSHGNDLTLHISNLTGTNHGKSWYG